MYSVLQEGILEEGQLLVVMPLSRVLVEDPIHIGTLMILPPGELNFQELGIDVRSAMPYDGDELTLPLQGDDLREIISSATGFCETVLAESAVVCFGVSSDWDQLEQGDHTSDTAFLSQLSMLAERSFDVVRLRHCRLDLPDTLPGAIGSWSGAYEYVGALIYNPVSGHSRLIAGTAPSYGAITRGIGLDMIDCDGIETLDPHNGEVGAIAIHALSLYSDALHARNDTAKFMRVMTLLEFLASPDEYGQWQKLKGDIVCHVAKDKAQYLNMLEELRTFTSDKNEQQEQIGYRTLVVHHGKFLHDILPSEKDRRNLFRRLQFYCTSVIEKMIQHSTLTWIEFEAYRTQLKTEIGIV